MPIDLLTKQGEALLSSTETPWQVYPRPQMRRSSYVNLNGQWAFSAGEEDFSQTIRVPFCPESQLSGVQQHFPEGTPLFYRRKFTLPEGFNKGRILLHIGAADQVAEIYVNQRHLTTHVGGYEAFSVDITDALQDENELVIRCTDDLRDRTFPYGKQVMKRGGMWYTPVSGIWQTVWLESVPQHYIRKLNIENRGTSVTISAEPPMEGKIIIPGLGEYPLGSTITPEDPHLWSPEDPYLYEFTVETAEDKVESYFALRSLEIKTIKGQPRLCLNGKPYFFHGLLDQGYWPDGLFTPAHPECYAEDILAMKNLGFNMLRKHIKVEPEEFYYQCDKLGMVVFQDMVNNGAYNFFRDTALPTIGIQKLNDKNLHKDPKTRQRFLDSMASTVNQLKNHPCICYWTIFNEGWGQFDSDNVCDQFRKLDNTRFIDTTSGWFRRSNTDVDSRHVYFKPVKLKPSDKPLVLSEFGGYSFKPEEHVFNTEQTYGYGKFEDMEEFADAVERLYLNEILPTKAAGLCAAVYTQVSDVEDETNGLLSYDRKVTKLDPARMTAIAEALKD
ncbi:MAG: glycoside hydrolase family 2 [Oscillospiraceae bacterium]|nr:glycoside hydrolase family 2 [Oscillospiraceae bacterium]